MVTQSLAGVAIAETRRSQGQGGTRREWRPQTTTRHPGPSTRATPIEAGTTPAHRGRVLFECHLDLLQRRLRLLSRRSGLPNHEAEEFCSWALFKLVEDGYRVLGSWQGRSSFATYAAVVSVNLLRDYQVHLWGKWRPSAAARRGGREAVLLERLWLRDGLPLDIAVEKIQREHGGDLSAAELQELAARFPRRTRRWRVGEEQLVRIPVDGGVEARLEDAERGRTATRLWSILVPILEALPADDRLLLKLHFRDNLSMAAISPMLGRTQRELYSRCTRCLKRLRLALEAEGLGRDRITDLIGWFQWDSSSAAGRDNGGI
jgi:RNA polymerase sigma factor (sigma-70 family)